MVMNENYLRQTFSTAEPLYDVTMENIVNSSMTVNTINSFLLWRQHLLPDKYFVDRIFPLITTRVS